MGKVVGTGGGGRDGSNNIFLKRVRFDLETAKGTRGRRRIASRQYRPTPYPLPSSNQDVSMVKNPKKHLKILEKKDWENATCSVCMEYPHNAVLLLCSSHDKGCHPYMCGISSRYSNCLDQYKKAYTKVKSTRPDQASHRSADNPIVAGSVSSLPVEKFEVTELACPLCRGQDNCPFVGTYKELRKHVREEHPSARPREVDPNLEQKWTRLERKREQEEVISTIRSSMPGAMVLGDYVIEGSHYRFDSDEEEDFDVNVAERNEGLKLGIDSNLVNVFFLFHAFGPAGNLGQNRGMCRQEIDLNRTLDEVDGFNLSNQDSDSDNDHGANEGMSLVGRLRRQGRVLLGQSGRKA
ncbi:hypothetical protein LOK49_LG08G00331 [Camellia lanceoleosa]|uniref:Uncharacterized protein n=1 Tax=Camellia lanceoleosa TaxID=1840588 RepID=A0ACC0GNL2_9ERIC|nr:hypothetical protein LOK49_LG08G00331 [Camellia lanceoleosa]